MPCEKVCVCLQFCNMFYMIYYFAYNDNDYNKFYFKVIKNMISYHTYVIRLILARNAI